MTFEQAVDTLRKWQVWTKGNWVGLAHAVDGDTPSPEEWSEIALALATITRPASPPEAPTPDGHSLLCRWTYDGVPHCALDCPLRQESP